MRDRSGYQLVRKCLFKYFIVRLERRTTEDSSSGRIMRLVPVFTLETNNECLPKFVQTHNASSSIKTANAICFIPGPDRCPLLFLVANQRRRTTKKQKQNKNKQHISFGTHLRVKISDFKTERRFDGSYVIIIIRFNLDSDGMQLSQRGFRFNIADFHSQTKKKTKRINCHICG